MDKRGEIFAEFTMSRIPQDVRNSLNEVQIAAIRNALIGMDQNTRHSIDVRLRVPLIVRTYYLVFFAGRDRRLKTLNLELHRINRLPLKLRRIFYLVASGSLFVTAFLTVSAILYLIKSFAGIDLMPNSHLSDFLPFDLFQEAKDFLGVKGARNET